MDRRDDRIESLPMMMEEVIESVMLVVGGKLVCK